MLNPDFDQVIRASVTPCPPARPTALDGRECSAAPSNWLAHSGREPIPHAVLQLFRKQGVQRYRRKQVVQFRVGARLARILLKNDPSRD